MAPRSSSSAWRNSRTWCSSSSLHDTGTVSDSASPWGGTAIPRTISFLTAGHGCGDAASRGSKRRVARLIDHFNALDGATNPVEDCVRPCVVQNQIVPEKAILEPVRQRRQYREDRSGHGRERLTLRCPDPRIVACLANPVRECPFSFEVVVRVVRDPSYRQPGLKQGSHLEIAQHERVEIEDPRFYDDQYLE